MGFKKRGFGAGKYAGIGGRVQLDESVVAAAARELTEEIGIRIPETGLQNRGCIQFLFPEKPAWNMEVHIFLASHWNGDPVESDEMKPVWFKRGQIPFDCMWQDAPHWLPPTLDGKRIQGTITFQDDNETISQAEVAICEG
ncbi:MAG: 8-oxo-dGTP diphosphatase [Chloroflexi bacterium]|nr:8-oxo-dGTP diphosphatase [Chloroflexota bacterium]